MTASYPINLYALLPRDVFEAVQGALWYPEAEPLSPDSNLMAVRWGDDACWTNALDQRLAWLTTHVGTPWVGDLGTSNSSHRSEGMICVQPYVRAAQESEFYRMRFRRTGLDLGKQGYDIEVGRALKTARKGAVSAYWRVLIDFVGREQEGSVMESLEKALSKRTLRRDFVTAICRNDETAIVDLARESAALPSFHVDSMRGLRRGLDELLYVITLCTLTRRADAYATPPKAVITNLVTWLDKLGHDWSVDSRINGTWQGLVRACVAETKAEAVVDQAVAAAGASSPLINRTRMI